MTRVKALILAAAGAGALMSATATDAFAQRGHWGGGHYAHGGGFPPGAIGHAGWRGNVAYGPRIYGGRWNRGWGAGFLPVALAAGALAGVAGVATGGYGLYDDYEVYPYQPAYDVGPGYGYTYGYAQPVIYDGPTYGYAPVWRPRRVVVRHHYAPRRAHVVRHHVVRRAHVTRVRHSY